MDSDDILEIGITEVGGIYVAPSSARFPFIFREAMEVSWDATKLRLYGPKPRDWSYLDWFRQIRSAAKKQGTDLQLTPQTMWTHIPDKLRMEIEAE